MNITGENVSFILLALLSISTILFRQKSRRRVGELFANPFWVLGLLTIVGFSIYVGIGMNGKSQDERIKTIDAYKKSLIAFIIAVFSEFGMSIGPFWLVFVFAYYTAGWV